MVTIYMIQVNGKMELNMEKALIHIQIKTLIQDNGSLVRNKEMALICIVRAT